MVSETELSEVVLSPEQQQKWIDVVAQVSLQLGMTTPPAVEFDSSARLKGGAGYDSGSDVLRIVGGWAKAEPDPWSLASRALIAHELGHRLDRDRLRAHRRLYIAGWTLLLVAIVVVFVATFVDALDHPGRFGPVVPWWLPVMLPTAVAAGIVLTAAVRWSDEYRADKTAAAVYGAEGVHAFLDVFDAHADTRVQGWIGATHPSHRMRRTAVTAVFGD